jgi:hypothetical protein
MQDFFQFKVQFTRGDGDFNFIADTFAENRFANRGHGRNFAFSRI